LICFDSPSSCRSSAREPHAIRSSAARVSGRRFCAPLRFPASYVPLLCLLCASYVHLYTSVPLQCLLYAPLRFYAASVHLYAFVPLMYLFCASLSAVVNLYISSSCIQHWLYTTLATTLLCILKCLPKSWNIIFIPIQMSHNRNMFLFWYGFCHLQKESYLLRLLLLLPHLRYLSNVFFSGRIRTNIGRCTYYEYFE
jgi:hypothetical protein